MKEESDERVKEEEEERDAWMADPFPEEKLRYWKVQLSMEVVRVEEQEDEGRIFTTEHSIVTLVCDVLGVIVMEWSLSSPSV